MCFSENIASSVGGFVTVNHRGFEIMVARNWSEMDHVTPPPVSREVFRFSKYKPKTTEDSMVALSSRK